MNTWVIQRRLREEAMMKIELFVISSTIRPLCFTSASPMSHVLLGNPTLISHKQMQIKVNFFVSGKTFKTSNVPYLPSKSQSKDQVIFIQSTLTDLAWMIKEECTAFFWREKYNFWYLTNKVKQLISVLLFLYYCFVATVQRGYIVHLTTNQAHICHTATQNIQSNPIYL